MPQKFSHYAVKRGHRTGIFTSWGEVLDATEDFDRPIYRGFNSAVAANAWLAERSDAEKVQKEYDRLIDRAVEGDRMALRQAEKILNRKRLA